MKKQWLSIVLVLCMVLCLAPATARAEETGTLKITVKVLGLDEGDDAGGKTFSFKILRKYAIYGLYKNVDITIDPGKTEGTMDVPVEAGKYIVEQIGCATIDGYDPGSVTYTQGEMEVFANKSKEITVNNHYEKAVAKEITELPITVTGYALNAKVGDIKATTEQMRVAINNNFTVKQLNASGVWEPLESDATIQADIQYGVEILVNAKPGYTYTGLTGDKVTVNGEEASVFENPSTQPGGDMRVFHEFEVLKVVKKVVRIEITTPPTKTEYKAGEDFDPTGMVVTAHYTDGTTADLSRDKYVIFHGDKLTQGQTYVTIQYNDGSGNSGIYVDLPITVKPYEGNHKHTYDNSWYSDAKSHWHWCSDKECPDPSNSTKDLASHTFVWKVDKEATKTQTGSKHEECTVCGHKRSENTVIPVLSDSGTTEPGNKPGSGTTEPGGTTTPGTTIPDTTDGTTGAAKSPKTGDAGIALYAGLSLLTLSGGGWVVGKKRREEKK